MKATARHFSVYLIALLVLTSSVCLAGTQSLMDTLKPMVENGLEGPNFYVAALTKQGYSKEEVISACQSLNVDWDKRATQAAEYANKNLQGGASQLGIAKLLAQIGYPNEQILYALKNCSIDWNRNAWLDARNITVKSGSNIDEQKLRSILQKLGFTPDQIDYACKYRLQEEPGE